MSHKILISMLLATQALAADPDKQKDQQPALPEPPELPPTVESGETMEPDITIIKRGKKTIQEYRINGEIYMVKVVPDIGPAYYLIDSDGDGNMDVRRSDIERDIRVPQWVIYKW